MESQPQQSARFNRTMRRACTWSALPLLVLLFSGMIIAEIMPPQFPSDTEAQVAEHYREHATRIRVGLSIVILGMPCLLAFCAVIAAQTRRIEGTPSFLTYAQIATFAPGLLIFTLPLVCWGTAAYRPDRDAGDVALIHDVGWLLIAFPYTIFSLWLVAIALTIFSVNSEDPDYPRWVGYYSVFVAISFVPDNFVFFFKEGPLAWSGIFAWWIPFVTYGIWVVIMWWLTLRAINREAVQSEPESPQVAGSTVVNVP